MSNTATANPLSAQYKHPLWQKKRSEILSRDDFKCSKCGCTNKQLHVHHSYYTRGLALWEYPNYCYITMCCDCHSDNHILKNLIKDALSQIERLSIEGNIEFDLEDAYKVLSVIIDPCYCAEHFVSDLVSLYNSFHGGEE